LSCCSIKAAYSTSLPDLVNRLFLIVSQKKFSKLFKRLLPKRFRRRRLVPQKWCAFYRAQENCQRPFSKKLPGLRFPPTRLIAQRSICPERDRFNLLKVPMSVLRTSKSLLRATQPPARRTPPFR